MFDAKSLLEQITGAGQRPNSTGPNQGSGQGSGLEDLLGGLLGGNAGNSGAAANAPGQDAAGGLGDLLRNITGGEAASGGNTAAGGGSGLDQILGQLKEKAGQLGGGAAGGGGILDVLGQVLGQATEGAKEGAGRIGAATGATDVLTQAAGGRTPEQIIAQVKDLIANNQLAAGAAMGGLGGLLIGTKTGREIATGTVKVGALALISGLAYKAYQNHQAGKPLITGPQNIASAAPAGSGFEPAAISNDAATVMIRAMIAAAAADGRIDDTEYGRIISSLGSGADTAEARAFLEREMRSPATPGALAAAIGSEAEALEVYAAARIAIDPDAPAEQSFLRELARALNIPAELAAQIDATARNATA